MIRIALIICLIMSMVMISPVSANDKAFDRFMKQVANEFGEQKPEIIIQTNKEVILIFALAKTMKQLNFSKSTGDVTTKEIQKLEDSTKSTFHQEPSRRLQEAVATYGNL